MPAKKSEIDKKIPPRLLEKSNLFLKTLSHQPFVTIPIFVSLNPLPGFLKVRGNSEFK